MIPKIELARLRLMGRQASLRRSLEGPPATGGATPPERQELAEIERALARIVSGQYGVCDCCGGAIGLQRLAALPETAVCTGCS